MSTPVWNDESTMLEKAPSPLLSADSVKVAFIAAVICWFVVTRTKKYRLPLPPGPFPLPIVGNALSMDKGAFDKTLSRWQARYGDIFQFYVGSRRIVVICGPEKLKVALTSDALLERSHKDPMAQEFSREMKGITFSSHQRWKETRRFSLLAMRDIGRGLGRNSLQDNVRQEALALYKQLQQESGKPVNLRRTMTTCVANVVSSIVFGERFAADDAEFQEALDATSRLLQAANGNNIVLLFHWLQRIPYFYQSMAADQELTRRFICKRIEEHRQSFSPKHVRDAIDQLLLVESGDSDFNEAQFDAQHMYYTIRDLFFDGTEATANTLLWAMQFMVLHPSVQDKCRQEVHQTFGKEDLPELSWREHLPYVEATLNEIQRVGDAVPIGLLRYVPADMDFCGYTIPGDSEVLCFLHSAHRDPRAWPEPGKFRPERWLDENGYFLRHDAFMAFSLGERNCVGMNVAQMELFIFFTTVIQRFRLRIAPGTPVPSPDGVVGTTRAPDPCSIILTKL